MLLIIAGTVVGGRLASLDPFDLIWQASWVVQLVILLLVAASIISWAAIAFKWRELSNADPGIRIYQFGLLMLPS